MGVSGDDKSFLETRTSPVGVAVQTKKHVFRFRAGLGQNSTLGFLAKANLNQAATAQNSTVHHRSFSLIDMANVNDAENYMPKKKSLIC